MKTLAAALMILLTACDVTPATETVVVLRAAESVRARTTRVRVAISGRSGEGIFVRREERTLTLADAEKRFPLLLTVTPRRDDAARSLRVVATALDAQGSVVSVGTVQTGFVERATRIAELVLDEGRATWARPLG